MLRGNKYVTLEKGQFIEKELPAGMTVQKVLAGIAITKALKGHVAFLKEITDRTEGKVPVRVADANGNALQAPITIVRVHGIAGVTAELVQQLGGPQTVDTTFQVEPPPTEAGDDGTEGEDGQTRDR